jgi:DNA-binding Lrp family transcriptional regulator
MTAQPSSTQSSVALAETDRRLLAALDDLPLVAQPYRRVAEVLNVGEAIVLDRIQYWRTTGAIRCVVAMFNSRRMGYASTLAATHVAPDRIDAVAEIITASSAVSHNFLRDDPQFNLWFTVTAPDASFDATLEGLASAIAQPVRRFDVTAHYKISFRSLFGELALSAGEAGSSLVLPTEHSADSALQREVLLRTIDAIQQGLPVTSRPFRDIADRIGADEDAVIGALQWLRSVGVMRRLGALIDAGVVMAQKNAMVVWRCDADDADALGRVAAGHPRISHSYRRQTFADWPWSVYTVIHGNDADDVHRIIGEVSQGRPMLQHRVLWTLRQFKQQPIRYDPAQIRLPIQ